MNRKQHPSKQYLQETAESFEKSALYWQQRHKDNQALYEGMKHQRVEDDNEIKICHKRIGVQEDKIKELKDEMAIKDELLAALLEGSERVSKKLDELRGR